MCSECYIAIAMDTPCSRSGVYIRNDCGQMAAVGSKLICYGLGVFYPSLDPRRGGSVTGSTSQAIQLQQYKQRLQQMHQQLILGQQQLKELQKHPNQQAKVRGRQAKLESSLSLTLMDQPPAV